jgi:sorbitol/mannitol transport system permease protein
MRVPGIMPPVAALIWKTMILHPGYGVFADIAKFFGATPVDWIAPFPLGSIIAIVAWQWLPFATLILLTALQSLDSEQKEAAERSRFRGARSKRSTICR